MARWFRCSLSVARPFVCGCLPSCTMLRFHIPLIKPDVRISRIRLSDKEIHAFAHGKLRLIQRSRTSPSLRYKDSAEKRDNPAPRTLCFVHNH